MLQVRKKQFDAINKISKEDFVYRIVNALIDEGVNLSSAIPEAELQVLVTDYWDEANALTIENERDVYQFIRLKFKYDDSFWESDALERMKEWLSSPYVPSKIKIQKLNELATEQTNIT
jgi:hypothetical protein